MIVRINVCYFFYNVTVRAASGISSLSKRKVTPGGNSRCQLMPGPALSCGASADDKTRGWSCGRSGAVRAQPRFVRRSVRRSATSLRGNENLRRSPSCVRRLGARGQEVKRMSLQNKGWNSRMIE